MSLNTTIKPNRSQHEDEPFLDNPFTVDMLYDRAEDKKPIRSLLAVLSPLIVEAFVDLSASAVIGL